VCVRASRCNEEVACIVQSSSTASVSERMVYDVGWGASDIVKRVVD
jgi:hypothetical protein